MKSIEPAPERAVTLLKLEDISPNPAQPRTRFSEDSLSSLAESIRQHGLICPLLVRRVGAQRYELIAGERRYRALKKLGRRRAEAIVIPAFDSESALLALIENLQREQLHFLEEAAACRSVLDMSGVRQEDLARKLNQSPSALANRLRLLRLSPAVRDYLPATALTERHARALLNVKEPEEQLSLARQAAEKRFTVGQLERIIAAKKPRRTQKSVLRDERLYVNAVMDTITRIRDLGAQAEASVTRSEAGTEIRILLRHP